MTAKKVAASLAGNLAIPDPAKCDPSPTLVERETAKNEKYSRLLFVAQKQAREKKRVQAPSFSTFAVSDYGEVAPVAGEVQEWLVNQFRVKCERAGDRADGCKTMDLTRDFRNRLRLGVQMAVAAGCGEMLCRAGRAWLSFYARRSRSFQRSHVSPCLLAMSPLGVSLCLLSAAPASLTLCTNAD